MRVNYFQRVQARLKDGIYYDLAEHISLNITEQL
jgi:hypothetical protein